MARGRSAGPGGFGARALDPSVGAHLFADTRHGPASELVPAWVDELLRQHP